MSYDELFHFYQRSEVCTYLRSFKPNYCGVAELPSIYYMGECAMFRSGISQHSATCNLFRNFLRHESTTINSKSSLDVIALLKKHKTNAFFFVGDSLTGQHIMDTVCTLRRHGLHVTTTDMFYTRYIHNPSDPTQTQDAMKEHMSIQDAFFTLKLLRMDKYNEWDTVRLFNETLHNAKLVHNHGGKPVFLINWGVHYHLHSSSPNADGAYQFLGRDVYRKHIRELLRLWIKLAKTKNYIIIFRETSAQHFPTFDGIFDEKGSVETNAFIYEGKIDGRERRGQELLGVPSAFKDVTKEPGLIGSSVPLHINNDELCVPLTTEEQVKSNNWRNEDVYMILDELDPHHQYIHIIKFHRFTASRHESHSRTDCTHFCHNPMIWLPLWQQIYDILLGIL